MKKLGILVTLALLSTLLVLPASAQGIQWTSGFQVQNLSTNAADIVIYYYNQDGTQAIAGVSATIPAMGSATYFPIHAADGFNGSVVIESTEPVVAIANTLGNSPQYMASTESFAAGANSVNLPLIMKGNAGYYTWFNVQNTSGTADAHVTVEFIPGEAGTAYTAPAVTIAPGAAATFNQRDLADLGTRFVGSAVITSDQPIVASVMQVGDTYKNMMGYNGFTAGAPTVNLPLVMANNSGFYTGFQVQNVGTASTVVTVDFGANIGGTFSPADQTATLAPDESVTFLQNTGQFGATAGRYVGSATLTTDNGQPIVAIVNQVSFTGMVVGTAYNGFAPSEATNKVSAPLIMYNNNSFYTGYQIMNVGGSAVSVDITYGPNTAGTFQPANETGVTIQPGDSLNRVQSPTGEKYVGSMTATAADGSQIVMIVNEFLLLPTADAFMTYNGFNY